MINARNNEPTYWWQGASGRWYIHTVYPIHAIPGFKACNYIFARPRFDGTREPFYIGQSGEFDERLDRHEKLGPALWLGATEIHVHLLAQSRQERLNIETDLRHGHVTPLNEQPTSPLRTLADLLLPPALPDQLSALAGLFSKPVPSESLRMLADLLKSSR